jgi:DNA-binding protein HU-beta
MNKADLIAKLAPKLNITQDEARIVLNSVLLEVITEALVEDKNVRLVDFGTFEVKQRAERMGHNPKTGEKLKIEAKKIVTFKQGKALGEQFIVKPKQKVKLKKKA